MNEESMYRREPGKEPYFPTEFPLRFSDYFRDGSIPLARLLSLFEESRFTILKAFRAYCDSRTPPPGIEVLDQTRFVVTQLHFHGASYHTSGGIIQIRTCMVPEPVPLLKFIHVLDNGSTCEITTAMLDEHNELISRWDTWIYRQFLRFIEEKGVRNAVS